ncbi:MAG TPA: acetamidase/formamidase family protein [Thermomicrobiales bacterium]|nr:acetamidase/formamidase family protein [Thermomicrobiales bacterium]
MAAHHFTPDHYFSTIGSHEPVLRIADGDTVVTTTIDAGGFDGTDQRAHPGGNPQTGPFYVEGAEQGDALAVRLDSITPNRRRGFSATVIAERVLDPDFVRGLPEQTLVDWDVDVAAGTVRLGDLVLPIAPMIGCFGVAPPRGQAISTGTSSTHGGNMDYRGHVAGVTVYFPVAVEGALFHIGDGHAVQGDGEIVGTGVEISMDVRFTVHVIKHTNIQWPRTENDDYIMALGNARPLDEALQYATTELVRWLAHDYGMDTRAASILLGQTIEYEIGNVFDPAYTVVAKLRKKWLPAAR